MKKLLRKIYRGEKGFTLVELMIVIIILAILTGIAVPSYMALRNNAREAAAKSEMKNIATALELYMADIETYPVGTAIGDAETALETGEYMDPVPTLDPWGLNNYGYASDGDDYTLTCTSTTPNIVIINGQLQP